MKSNYTNNQVNQVSDYLQQYMKRNNLDSLVPDQCADLLAKNNILSNDVGPKPGFNFRQMLRDGRDGIIPLVTGADQEAPNKRWIIKRI